MTKTKGAPRRCVNGHDLNDPNNWVLRTNKNGADYRRCKPCLETSGQAERRRRARDWHAARAEDKDGVRRSAGIPDPRRDWRQDALCANDPQIDSELFFMEGGAKTAVDVCKACPVKMSCLAEHLYEKFGIFGGTTPEKRDLLRRNGRRNLTKRTRRNG